MFTIKIDVLGVGFDNLTMKEATCRAMELMRARGAEYVVTPNPEIVMQCRSNPRLAKAVSAAAMVLPDGIGIVYGAKILGTPLKGKLAGIDFVSSLFEQTSQQPLTVFLLGAKPGVAEKAAAKLQINYPELKIVGTNDGFFDDDDPVIEKINAASPDLLLVCLGAPKQELWMQNNAPRLNVGLMLGLGGVLDVFSGETQRAPQIWQKLGLEWLYRLTKEPGRIVRMANLPKFGLAVIGKRMRG